MTRMIHPTALLLIGLLGPSPVVHAAAPGPVKAFVLSGQSNMVGWAHVRTLDALADDPDLAPWLARLRSPDGAWAARDDVFIDADVDDKHRRGRLTVGYGGGDEGEWIGPELLIGSVLGDAYDEPVLLIKGAWGGKDLYCDFRPPSAGDPPYSIPERDGRPRDVGANYRKLVAHVRASLEHLGENFPELAGRDVELAGFLWFQGWNEMFAGDAIQEQVYEEYPANFAHLLADLRRDLGAPDLKAVVGVLGVGGDEPGGRVPDLRAAQARIADQPALRGAVAVVPTAPCWAPEVHDAFRNLERVKSDEIRALEPQVADELAKDLADLEERQRKQRIRDEADRRAQRTEAYLAADAAWRPIGSHWECHYHGSGKVYCRIGKALAEAMLGLRDS